MKLPSITVGEIKKFEIWLSKIPARSTIVEDEDGKLVLNINENGGQRGIESINRPVELLRTIFNGSNSKWPISVRLCAVRDYVNQILQALQSPLSSTIS